MCHSRYLEGRFKWLLIDGRVHGPEIAVMGEIGLRIRAKELDEVVAMCKVTDNRTIGIRDNSALRVVVADEERVMAGSAVYAGVRAGLSRSLPLCPNNLPEPERASFPAPP
jgi:hypothetical protein